MDIRPLITAEEIDTKLADLGKQISEDYKGKEVLLVGVLTGAFMVMADLARHIDLPVEFDFMAVSSYGASHADVAVWSASSRTSTWRSEVATC